MYNSLIIYIFTIYIYIYIYIWVTILTLATENIVIPGEYYDDYELYEDDNQKTSPRPRCYENCSGTEFVISHFLMHVLMHVFLAARHKNFDRIIIIVQITLLMTMLYPYPFRLSLSYAKFGQIN